MQSDSKLKIAVIASAIILVVCVSFVVIKNISPKKQATNQPDQQSAVVDINAESNVATVPVEGISINPVTKKAVKSLAYGRFSYKKTALVQSSTVQPSNPIIPVPSATEKVVTVGATQNDPQSETVIFYSDTTKVDPSTIIVNNTSYVFQGKETVGNNIFDVYLSSIDGSKVYILTNMPKAIEVIVPFSGNGGDTQSYIDLGSLRFLLSDT